MTLFKTATGDELPDAVAVMDPFHVVALAGHALHRDPDRTAGKAAPAKVINSIARGVPEQLIELVTLGRTLNRRAADVLA